jgi:N-acetylglucosamine-6-phosphate deacetylase
MEGPFISRTCRGVHPPEYLMAPTVAAFNEFWEASRGNVRMMTIAPELPGTVEVIAEAVRRGVCVSLGHTDADAVASRAGIAAGARHATHTFNAMRPLKHRDPGVIGEVLTNDSITADIIADGIHLDPEIVRLFLKAKGEAGAVLITDGIAATGMPDGKYQLGSLEVEVKNGRCESGGRLAGSVLTMDRAVKNVVEFAGWSLPSAIRLASLNPANVAGLKASGRIAEGARADFVVLDESGNVKKTVIGGRIL